MWGRSAMLCMRNCFVRIVLCFVCLEFWNFFTFVCVCVYVCVPVCVCVAWNTVLGQLCMPVCVAVKGCRYSDGFTDTWQAARGAWLLDVAAAQMNKRWNTVEKKNIYVTTPYPKRKTRSHTHIYTQQACTCSHIHTHTHTHTNELAHLGTHTHTHTHTWKCTHIHTSSHTCMETYVHIHTHTHTLGMRGEENKNLHPVWIGCHP